MDYFKIITINNKRLCVYKNGEVLFWDNCRFNTKYKFGWNIHKDSITKKGYIHFSINDKKILKHRIIGMAFLNLDINDSNSQIDHIDGNKQNNNLENLRIVSNQENQWNRKNTKGYRKIGNKFYPRILFNNKSINLGCFDTAEEARQAYLNAKEIYHKIGS